MKTIYNFWVIAPFATIGGLLQGFDVSCLTSILGTDQYNEYFGSPDALLQGGITASMAGGSMLGCLASSPLSDQIGRRDTMMIGCLTFCIGSTIMAAAQNVPMLIVSRMINGFGVGFLTTQAPMYLAEISPPHLRGRLISFQAWMITLGEVIMSFTSYGTSFIPSTASWRIPWGVQMIPAIFMAIALMFLPRSPRWLASKDRWDEAKSVLANLHAQGNALDPFVVAEFKEIQDTIILEKSIGAGSWADLFKKENLIRVHISIFAHIWSQLTGGNAVMYYIVYIMEMAGLTGNIKLISASIQYVVFAVMGVIPVIFMDRFRLRHVMIAGSVLSATCHFITGSIMATKGQFVPGGLNGSKIVNWNVSSKSASTAIIAFSYIFIGIYATTWSPVSWVYPPPCIPLAFRGKTMAVGTFFNWGFNFAQTFLTPTAFENIQWKFYMIFGTLCVVSATHVFLLFPETKGKTLEEMDVVFATTIWGFKTTNLDSRLSAEIQEAREQMKQAVEHRDDATADN